MKNNAILISTGIIGCAAIGLYYYFNTNKNTSNDRRLSIDSNVDVGDLPISREPSIDNESRTSSIDSAGTYDYFFHGGSKYKISKRNKKTKRNKKQNK